MSVTVADPAVEAAQRAWTERYHELDGLAASAYGDGIGAFVVAAAREALKPIRELHRKYRLYDLAVSYQCDSHDTFEDLYGETCCRTCTDEETYACLHCADLDSNSEWPCETAKLIYSTEELES